MSWHPPVPLAAPSASELLAGLSAGDRLAGYEAILTALIEAYGPVASTACIRASRDDGIKAAPSVVLLLADTVVESWLDGGRVVTASCPRPGAQASAADPIVS